MDTIRTLSFFCIVIILTASSCIKRPTAAFHCKQTDNPESGEKIEFVNESLDALYYYWDFGNGESSEEENPSTIYDTPGDYTVTLVAESKYRTDSIEETILIMPPTILELYFFSYNIAPFQLGTVYLWKSKDDALRGKQPIKLLNTNAMGRVAFKNLEARRYFVYIEKDTINGIYQSYDGIGPLEQNKINTYYGYVYFYKDKKALSMNNAHFEDMEETHFLKNKLEKPGVENIRH